MEYTGTTKEIVAYIRKKFGVRPDHLWARTPNSAAFRHLADKKWFGALMLDLPRQRLGLDGDGRVDVLNLKLDPKLSGSLRDGRRYLPGYHMNKEHWITLLLDGSIPAEEICPLIDLSFQLTLGKKEASK